MAIFLGKGTTKSQNLKMFKSQYLSEFLSYGPDFLHVIIDFIGFKGWPKKSPPPHLAENLKRFP